MADPHQSLEAYYQGLLNFQDQKGKGKIFSSEELKSMALELGLSESDWDQLQQKLGEHLTRGTGFVRFENWDDAIIEFDQALRIHPFHLTALENIAAAYHKKWQQSFEERYRRKALSYAQTALQIKADHEPSLQLISTLKQDQSLSDKRTRARNRGRIMIIAAAVVIGILVASSVILWQKGERRAAEEEVLNQSIPAVPESKSQPLTQAALRTPVLWTENVLSADLTFLPEKSEFKAYDVDGQKSFSYVVTGDIQSLGHEISLLTLRVSLLGEDGILIREKVEEVIGETDPNARPGDAIAFGHQQYEKTDQLPQISQVQIAVENIRRTPAPDAYESSPAVRFTWEPSQPPNVNLEIRERAFSRSETHLIGRIYDKLEIEVENTGKLNLELLKLGIRWYTPNDSLLQEETHFVVGPSDPSLKIGAVKVSGRTFGLDADSAAVVARHEWVVLEVDY
ncbi:MAG: hypothetical protein AAF206_07295 [Bacteroidota bacterium]